MSLPKEIIIIRHGEKPKDSNFFGLSQQGLARSVYLVDYFLHPVEVNNQQIYDVPDLIYCFNTHNGVNRSKQLMQPLIDTGISYDGDFVDDDTGTTNLVNDLFTSKNINKVLLICWEHSFIPSLIQQIGNKLSNGQNIYEKFRYWATNPKKGVNNKNDDDLYSLTVVIQTNDLSLKCVNQSDTFTKNNTELKKLDNYSLGFTLP